MCVYSWQASGNIPGDIWNNTAMGFYKDSEINVPFDAITPDNYPYWNSKNKWKVNDWLYHYGGCQFSGYSNMCEYDMWPIFAVDGVREVREDDVRPSYFALPPRDPDSNYKLHLFIKQHECGSWAQSSCTYWEFGISANSVRIWPRRDVIYWSAEPVQDYSDLVVMVNGNIPCNAIANYDRGFIFNHPDEPLHYHCDGIETADGSPFQLTTGQLVYNGEPFQRVKWVSVESPSGNMGGIVELELAWSENFSY